MEKGLLCELYRSRHGSSEFAVMKDAAAVVLVGIDAPFIAGGNTPGVRLVKRHFGGQDHYHAEPLKPGFYEWDGAFVYAVDDRFPADYPIPLWDRDLSREYDESKAAKGVIRKPGGTLVECVGADPLAGYLLN